MKFLDQGAANRAHTKTKQKFVHKLILLERIKFAASELARAFSRPPIPDSRYRFMVLVIEDNDEMQILDNHGM